MGRVAMPLLALACLCACAGTPGRRPDVEPLRRMVPESFHFNIQNPKAVRYLVSAEPGSPSDEKGLEMTVLKGLAQVPSEESLPTLFDRLWEEHREVRALVDHPRLGRGMPYPLVEIYYLLSSSPAQSWQEQASERLYNEALLDLQPDQISGYALHFYTLALLKNSKFAIADPFLRRLEYFKSRSDYLKDLTLALTYATAGGANQFACRLMAAVCRTWARSTESFPDEAMKEAALSLRRGKGIEEAREILSPLIRRNPSLGKFAFAEVLEMNGEAALSKRTDTDAGSEGSTRRAGIGVRGRGEKGAFKVYFKNGRELLCNQLWQKGDRIYLVTSDRNLARSYDQEEIDLERSFHRIP